MIESICPKCNVPIQGEVCVKESCKTKTIISTTIYWCSSCNVPIFERVCPCCGSEGMYVATDVRPVFPEEKILLAIILDKKDAHCYDGSSVWFGSGAYIVNGQKIKISIGKINQWSLDKIQQIKKLYDREIETVDRTYFDLSIGHFISANKGRYNFINEESIHYIQGYRKKYKIEDMMVSFSGGKDSTVISHLVTKALGTNKILHVFGDTTLEFRSTMEYKKRFNKNPESFGIRIITAKNREKKFEELCKVIGIPSRVMRWCCTVFKTGAIQKTISSAFKDKTNILTFYGIRRNESNSRSKYERESESPKISKQTVISPIIDWIDFDIWLYILTTGIDFNDAYRLGYSRVGCWCCPNNGGWSEFLSKVHMFEKYEHWREVLLEFAKQIGKPDPEEYIDGGNWKARQGGNGLPMAQKSMVAFEPCVTEENAFNYDLQKPITAELYELFRPFGYINRELGNKRLGEVYVMDKKGNVVLILQGKLGSTNLKITIKKTNIAKARSLAVAEGKIKCQLTKYQMCIGCKACDSVCKYDAIAIREEAGEVIYRINDEKCTRCAECISHFDAGCYMRKVLTIKRG